MLLELPKEVITYILDFLAFQDRLNLVKTCRHLRTVISKKHLYEELPTFMNAHTLRAALDTFTKYPLHGSQVKRITLKDTLYNVETSAELPSVFPAIKEFRTVDPSQHDEQPNIEMLLPWKNTLEVVDGGSKHCIGFLLKDHLFSHLSSLTMFLPGSYYNKNYTSNITFQENLQLFDCLKNTPSLRHMELYGSHLYVEHLERLHKVCPQLTSLYLHSMTLHAPDIDVKPSIIEPATQLLSLRIDWRVQIYNLRNAVLEYIIAKYTRLTEFAFLGLISKPQSDFTDNSGRLRSTPSDECHREGKLFISSLPTTIKILQLNTYSFDNPLAALDESKLDPTELAFYRSGVNGLSPSVVVKRTGQLRSLQSLKSLRSLTLALSPGMKIDSIVLDGILHLKVLVLYGPSDDDVYYIDDIMSVYPSLKSLLVVYKGPTNEVISLTGINRQSKEVVYTSLKKLSIAPLHFNPKAIERIPTLFPNLKELEARITYRYEEVDPVITINLNGCNLDILNLTLICYNFFYPTFFVYLHIKSSDILKIYRVELKDRREGKERWEINRIAEINEGEDTGTSNKFRVICDNVKTLNINGANIKQF